MVIEELKKSLRGLRLHGMLETIDARSLEAAEDRLPFMEVFSMLVQDELDRKYSKMTERKFRASGLIERKELKGFDWNFNPQVPRRECLELSTLKFIEKGEDAMLIGNPGTGKSHVAKAIVQLAAERGLEVYYREAHTFFEELFEAEELKMKKKLRKKINKADLLVIDDLFLRKKVHPEAADNLQEVILDRYSAKKSTLITSNRVVDDWGKCLGDNVVSSAILDRLMHRGHLLKFVGKSYRLREAAKRGVAKSKEAE